MVVLYLESIFVKIRLNMSDTEAYDTKTRRNRKRRRDGFYDKFFSEEWPRVRECSREESLTVPVYAKRSLKTAPLAAKLLL